jgi:hypothetical protein
MEAATHIRCNNSRALQAARLPRPTTSTHLILSYGSQQLMLVDCKTAKRFGSIQRL